MKKQFRISALLFLAGLLTSGAAFAQRGPGDGRGGGGWDRGPGRPGGPGRGDMGRGRWETTTVYRLSNGRDYMMSSDPNEGAQVGYRADRRGTIELFRNDDRGYRQPLYRCRNVSTGNHFASNALNCEGHLTEFILGYLEINADQRYANTQVYRCYNERRDNHLITTWQDECYRQGYRVEGGMGFIAR